MASQRGRSDGGENNDINGISCRNAQPGCKDCRAALRRFCARGQKIEPEQIRKNVATIQCILIETRDFLAEYLRQCSDSDK